ncbi:hypothetical protein RvVAR031_07520 [Agrobacterium vitis]|nr:hypothetical protein RvVAR031_07520 [Agrobacterium vitis]
METARWAMAGSPALTWGHLKQAKPLALTGWGRLAHSHQRRPDTSSHFDFLIFDRIPADVLSEKLAGITEFVHDLI